MADSEIKAHVFKPKSWEPIVEYQDTHLIYRMPVANGHFDKTFKFEISQQHFQVLKDDVERRYFLYALLHARYQPRAMTNDVLYDRHFDVILLGAKRDVERLLDLQDTQSNRAISNLVTMFLEHDQKKMIAGHWFLDPSDPI